MSTDHVCTRWRKVNLSTEPGDWPSVTRLTSGPELAKLPPGFSAWAIGRWDDDPERRGTFSNDADDPGCNAVIVVLPTLIDDAPEPIQHRLMARGIALGTGMCPLCSGRAALDREPPTPGGPGRAVSHALALFVRVHHASGCPAEDWTDAEREWFVPSRENHDERSR